MWEDSVNIEEAVVTWVLKWAGFSARAIVLIQQFDGGFLRLKGDVIVELAFLVGRGGWSSNEILCLLQSIPVVIAIRGM